MVRSSYGERAYYSHLSNKIQLRFRFCWLLKKPQKTRENHLCLFWLSLVIWFDTKVIEYWANFLFEARCYYTK